MFTGIIQTLGKVVHHSSKDKQDHFVFEWQKTFSSVELGESIAVNGVCLTVAKVEPKAFHADVIIQTLQATNLGRLKVGDFVNLERSLKWGDAIGGHFVSGHVDGYGRIQKLVKDGNNQTFTIYVPPHLQKFVIPKGSIAINGVSLTIQTVQKETFTVGLVPHTLQETSFGKSKVGDRVNLEADLMVRYFYHLKEKDASISWDQFLQAQDGKADRFIAAPKKSKITMNEVKSQGF